MKKPLTKQKKSAILDISKERKNKDVRSKRN